MHEETVPRPDAPATLLRGMFESSPDAVITMDANGRTTGWNREAERLFGWSREEALGRDVAGMAIPERFRAAHRAALTRFLQSGKTTLAVHRMEMWGQDRQGREFPVEVTITPVHVQNQWMVGASLRDLTGPRQTQELFELRERMALFHADLGRALTQAAETQTGLQESAEAIVKWTGASLARIWKLRDPQGELELMGSAGVAAHVDGS